jgi:RimJ/RimL family protein N-acetyltransferase
MPGASYQEGEEIALRTVQPEDHQFIHQHWNDQTIRYGAPMASPISKKEIARLVQQDDESVQFLPCIENDPVGFVFLSNIDPLADHAELGYWVIPEERGKGYATEAAELCLNHAFEDRGLHKVAARVFEENTGSRRVLEKLGFQKEGRLREHRYVNGEHKDVLMYGLLTDDAKL